jgi:hypothetical protein
MQAALQLLSICNSAKNMSSVFSSNGRENAFILLDSRNPMDSVV